MVLGGAIAYLLMKESKRSVGREVVFTEPPSKEHEWDYGVPATYLLPYPYVFTINQPAPPPPPPPLPPPPPPPPPPPAPFTGGQSMVNRNAYNKRDVFFGVSQSPFFPSNW